MSPRIRELTVTLYGQAVGTIIESGASLTFRYDDSYLARPTATPLSLSMPLSEVPYTRAAIETFLKGLLPDNEQVRRRWANHFSLKDGDTFGLIAAIGNDAAGGAIYSPEPAPNSGRLEPISDKQIAARLRRLREDEDDWLEDDERWSLAGAQSKFTLRQTAKGWAIAYGHEPSSHIIKPGISRLNGQALVEHVSMQSAARLGLSVAKTQYLKFEDQPAIVVERFDRRPATKGGLARVHQEDLCQALRVIPAKKYESDGGPGIQRITSLLREHSNDDSADRFIQAVIVNYLLGAPDAHAKNYSILLAGNTITLAPLYDIGSGLLYLRDSRLRYPTAAMALGGSRNFGELTARNWAKLAQATNYPLDQIREWVALFATTVTDAVEDSIKTIPPRTTDRQQLRTHLQPRVAALAQLTLEGLTASNSSMARRAKNWASTHLANIG